jgi:hypothetical protein
MVASLQKRDRNKGRLWAFRPCFSNNQIGCDITAYPEPKLDRFSGLEPFRTKWAPVRGIENVSNKRLEPRF